MALLESIDIPMGTKLDSFILKDIDGNSSDIVSLKDKNGIVVVVTCNHCPYAKAVWNRLVVISEFSAKLDISFVAVNPNINPDYPEDSPRNMKSLIKEYGVKFPYLIDETQEFAKKLKAQCTPDIYLFDKDAKLFYHGRIDDNWKDESKVRKEELKDALMNLYSGKPSPKVQYPSIGCSIKWVD